MKNRRRAQATETRGQGGGQRRCKVKQRATDRKMDPRKMAWHKPVLERRCIWDFCFELEFALLMALEAGLVFAGCATAMLTCDALMGSS